MGALVSTVLETFPKKTIVIVGDLVADQFLTGSISRVSREAPVFILRHEETETRPGAAANAAVNVASMGGQPVVIGVIGKDETGRLLRERLSEARVNCEFIVSNGGSTTTKVRVLAGQSYSVKQQVIRIDYEHSGTYSNDLKKELAANLNRAVEDADAILISDYGYGVVSAELFDQAHKAGERHNIPVIVDSRYRLREFAGATSATPNQEEIEGLLGAEFTQHDCLRLCEELGFQSLVVTLGNKGMIIAESGREPITMPVVGPTEPVDVTGAGDTVIAAYSLGLASGLSPYEAATIANHAGGIVVMKKGTATVSASELIDSLTARGQRVTDLAV